MSANTIALESLPHLKSQTAKLLRAYRDQRTRLRVTLEDSSVLPNVELVDFDVALLLLRTIDGNQRVINRLCVKKIEKENYE